MAVWETSETESNDEEEEEKGGEGGREGGRGAMQTQAGYDPLDYASDADANELRLLEEEGEEG